MKTYSKLRHVTQLLIEDICQENGCEQLPSTLYKEIATTLDIASVPATAKIYGISESTVYLIKQDLESETNIF